METAVYEKEMTPFYKEIPLEVKFEKLTYHLLPKEERFSVDDLESFNVLDVNRYKKEALKEKIGDFIEQHDYQKIKEKV